MKKKRLLIVLILLMSIGFASVSTTLIIQNIMVVSENKDDFQIIFTNTILDYQDVYDEIVDETKQRIFFTTSDLKKVGDKSVLDYEITNNSLNYDAEVTINCGLKNGLVSEYTSITNVFDNEDGIIFAKNTMNGTLTIKLDKASTNEITEEYTCTLTFDALERESLGVRLTQFQKDSWKTIVKNVKSGNTSKYNVGDTKALKIATHTNTCASLDYNNFPFACQSELELEHDITVRIANKEACTNGETSETACGFVIEFVDIIENYTMSPSTNENNWGTNAGGWKDSILREYLNTTMYNSLPEDLRKGVTLTKVLSGHGNHETANIETDDYFYLLSTKEVWGIAKNDTVDVETKQLEYYKNLNVSLTENYDAVIKQYRGEDYYWWLRSAVSGTLGSFSDVEDDGTYGQGSSYPSLGVSPAFRIA